MRAEWQLSSGTELRIANGMERCVYSVVGAVHNRYGGTWEGAKGALLSAVQVRSEEFLPTYGGFVRHYPQGVPAVTF